MPSRLAGWIAPLLLGLALPSQGEGDEDLAGGLRLTTEQATPGYRLLSPIGSRASYLLDLDGRVAHRWVGRYEAAGAFELLDDGSLLRCGRAERNPRFAGGGQGGVLERIAWDGELLWTFGLSSGEHLQHHDLELLPNGHVVVIAWEHRSLEEALAVGRDPEHVGEPGMWPDVLLEIAPAPPDGGEVVWEWRAWDHLVQDFDPERSGYGDVTRHPELIDVNADHRREPPLGAEERARREREERDMRALGYVLDVEEELEDEQPRRGAVRPDWLHTNALDHHPELDLLLLSVRSLDELWIIDHSTTTQEAAGHSGGRHGRGGDLLYRWGNPRNYGAGGPGDQQLFAQHDAQWIPAGRPGAGRVLLFNNGGRRPGGPRSTVDELELPFDVERGFARAPGAAFGPPGPAWSCGAREGDPSFLSTFLSGVERLPSGHTLICSGAEGRVLEVTPGGRVVWDWRHPAARAASARDGEAPAGDRGDAPAHEGRRRGGLFRVAHVPTDHPALAGD